MSCGIYKITIGDHYYFGQSSDLVARRRAHHYSLKKQSHYNKHMQRCFDKYQEFSFEILLYCDEDNLDMYEQRLINTHIDDRKCMNISKRVGVYSRGHKVSEEEKIKSQISRSKEILAQRKRDLNLSKEQRQTDMEELKSFNSYLEKEAGQIDQIVTNMEQMLESRQKSDDLRFGYITH